MSSSTRIARGPANGSTRLATVFLNRGDATFAPPASFDTGYGPYSLIAADVDGNGALDLVTANQSSGSVSLLLGDGGGRFAAPYRYDVGADPRFVLAGDLDADGDTDLFAANHTSRDVTLLYSINEGQQVLAPYVGARRVLQRMVVQPFVTHHIDIEDDRHPAGLVVDQRKRRDRARRHAQNLQEQLRPAEAQPVAAQLLM